MYSLAHAARSNKKYLSPLVNLFSEFSIYNYFGPFGFWGCMGLRLTRFIIETVGDLK